MKTLEEWNRSEELRVRLHDILTTSPMKEALEVCLSLEIDAAAVYDPRADLTQHAALIGAEREGYFKAFRRLKALTQENIEVKPMPDPWAHFSAKTERN